MPGDGIGSGVARRWMGIQRGLAGEILHCPILDKKVNGVDGSMVQHKPKFKDHNKYYWNSMTKMQIAV